MQFIPKTLIILGIVLVLFGVIWQFGGRYLPFGKLPGDFAVENKNFKFYFPLTTSIVLSLVVSLLFFLYRMIK